ncbi:MAG: hydantoinase/oxoprolinase family protein [Candidatus Odinarchaeia archaeon]
MVTVLGLDVGGANTKLTLINFQNNNLLTIKPKQFYFPFWKRELSEYPNLLIKHISSLGIDIDAIDYFAVTTTAELSDVFFTKKQGILRVSELLLEVFPKNKIKFYTLDSKFISYDELLLDPLKIAAANWVATGCFFAKFFPDCLIIDIGSTTTDFIIVKNSKISNKGRTDVERLLHGELYYSGFLRTPVCSITDSVFFREKNCPLASEFFAIIADIHLILGNIGESDYTCDTPDNRQKTREYSLNRMSRMVCCDLNEIAEYEVKKLSEQILHVQLSKISELIKKIFEEQSMLKNKPVILTGIGRHWLKINLLKKFKKTMFILSDELKNIKLKEYDPSLAVAYLLKDFLEV